MADQEGSGKSVEDVVSDVTVKALQEFDSDEMRPLTGEGKPSSRPASVKSGSRPGSARPGSAKPGSVRGSRPSSGVEQSSRPASGADIEPRPPSAPKGSRPSSGRPSSGRPSSGRPTSQSRIRTPSRDGEQEPELMISGSRPESAVKQSDDADRPASRKSHGSASRPTSAAAERPSSGAERPASATRPDSGERPASATRPASGERPASATRPASGERPASATRPASGERPASATRPASGERPASATRPASGERPASATRPASGERPASATRPGSAVRPSSADRPQSAVKSEGRAPSPLEEEEANEQQPEQPVEEPEEEPVEEPAEDPAYEPMEPSMGGDDGDDGGDGGDGGDGDDEEGDYYDDEEEMEEQSEDGEQDLIVLDPDHPLMRRFQKALKNHLVKQKEKFDLELRELEEALKKKKDNRENVGVELYGVQQELARYQMMLEQKHDNFSEASQTRLQEEQQLTDIRNLFKDSQLSSNSERKTCADLQQEVENLALRIFYMKNAKEDVRSDISVMKRAAEKAETEVVKAEFDKHRQDLFVDRLVERVDKLKEDIAMYDVQIQAQADETKAARETLMEAQSEIEAISLEKKQLFQQWSSSLIGMRRRDEAHAAMSEALHQQQQLILSLETEIEGYKKQISKEQEQNEKLTLILNKTENDIATVKKMLALTMAKHEALKAEYSTFTRMLHETEQALTRASADRQIKESEVNALRKQIERGYMEKIKLEDAILERLRSQLTLDKAAIYTNKLTTKIRNRTKELDREIAAAENEIAHYSLEVGKTKSRVERLRNSLGSLDGEIRQKNEIITRSEVEIVRRNAIIERKQGMMDIYNKKLEAMISSAGGVELGPLEININSLQKSIDVRLADITELQQMWLREQSELVRLSRDQDEQSIDVERLKKQLTILSQKKIRIENEIDGQQLELNDIQRNIRNMQNEMLKLNSLLFHEKDIHHELQQDNVLKEKDFVISLKEAEKDSIQMESRLEELSEEKDRLLNSLIEAERQIMLWEKKTQLAQETRAAVDSEIGQGEIKAMKSEIHRMQVRYAQLMRQQEKMIQEMEKAVSRRDTIVTRGDAQQKMNKKVLTKGNFQRQLAELKKRIKQTIQDANNCDGEIQELREHQQALSMELEQKQINCQQLEGNSDTLDGDIDRLLEHKQKNLSELLSRQQRAKYYQQVKDGKYRRSCKDDSLLDQELERQTERTYAMSAIVDRLNQEFPHLQTSLRHISVALATRAS